MKLAIMQPYFFPYLGYFQLIFASDKFVFYDDVSYINRGWINRNRLLLNGEVRYFTVPLSGASQNLRIDLVGVSEGNTKWRRKMLDTFRMAYRNAAYRDVGIELLDRVLSSNCKNIAELGRASVEAVLEYLDLARSIVPSSRPYNNQLLKGQQRILDICKKENADVYINAIGGAKLYQSDRFALQGCELMFLRSQLPEYPQGTDHFVPGLSILDVIMHCTPDAILKLFPCYDLIPAMPDNVESVVGVNM